MAYLIKNLKKRNKGEILNITSNKKIFSLSLINKIHLEEKTIEVNNYKTTLKIPETGYWKLKGYINDKSNEYTFNLKINISQ